MNLTKTEVTTANTVESGTVSWQSPSNIALVKYWGKKGFQIPANPSISFTLNNAITTTNLEYKKKDSPSADIAIDFYFEGELKPDFAEKIKRFFNQLSKTEMPFLSDYHFTIHSGNSFPHSAGIASSASSMSALALCLCSMEAEIGIQNLGDETFYRRASHISRIGSGSAARSVYGDLTVWGTTEALDTACNEYAVPFTEANEVFDDFYDSILLVHEGQKDVSSRAGHSLMEANPFSEPRYRQARKNLLIITKAIKEGDVATFGRVLEEEAMSIHALMMVSSPPVVLFKPETWHIINAVKAYRQETGKHLYFTLDAGPNVHLLYPASIKSEVQKFIKEKLVVYCARSQWIDDSVGKGPKRLK